MEISKELLSEVLENEIVRFEIVSTKRITQIRIWYKDTEWHMYESWDIYHLAHKCKEWAVNLSPNKHALSSYARWGDIRNYKKTNGLYYICQHLVSGIQFEAETEPEAIFKACEYIMENKCGS